MRAKEFARGLMELAKRHEKDEVGIFDTNWCEICRQTAEFIINLDNELKDKEEQIAGFKKWYEANESEITKALNKPKEVDVPEFVTKPEEEPGSTGAWDGTRRDYEDGFNPNLIPEEVEEDLPEDTRDLYPIETF